MALKRMTLRDFVIVEHLELDFHDGFTVLTGETGAGKSILIDALQLTLGARADAGVAREGTARADLCAEFDPPAHIRPWLEAAGLEDAETLLLRRTVDAQGKSRAWINGTPATATQLRELGDALLDIHGQHAWQSLMKPDSMRGLLDAYAGLDAAPVRVLWDRWRTAQKALEQARQAQGNLQNERERLQWQISELGKLAPQPDEWDDLNHQHQRLSHVQALLEAAQSAVLALTDEDGGAERALAHAEHLLQEHTHIEPEFVNAASIVSSSLSQVQDVVHSLQTYLRRTEVDPGRLAELDGRVSQWMTLARRYKRMPADLPALWADWRQQLASLDAQADLAALEAGEATQAKAYQTAARKLAQARRKAAPRLAAAVTQHMQVLGMAGGRFEVKVEDAATPQSHGLDDVEFLVAGHPGMSPKPVAKVASGGELSRISLAIAVTTSQLGSAPTLIFDEVDSGVGGAVAEAVGRLMHQLGRDRQVLAVTHLPQVAAWSDHHLLVSKRRAAKGTTSQVQGIAGEARTEELARMLGGERLSSTTLAHAREMLEQARHHPARST